MSHYVSDSSEFVVGTVFIEFDDGSDDVVGFGEVLLGDVDLLPQLDLVVWVHLLGLVIEVLLGWRKFAPKPDLMNNFRYEIRSLLVIDRR